MNQQLTERLEKLPEILGKATTVAELNAAVVDLERLVLKSNYADSQSGSPEAAFEARDYILGERNTRGLSWKLNLMTVIAEANFCRMVRVGIHGGQTQILGQPENIDTTIRIFEAIVPVYDTVGKNEFTSYSDSASKEEGAATPHRAGWINQYLTKAPEAMGAAIEESRTKDTSGNSKLAKMVEERTAELNQFRASLVPAKPVKEPKAPKAPKAPKQPKGQKASRSNGSSGDESDSESEDDENTVPGKTPAQEQAEQLAAAEAEEDDEEAEAEEAEAETAGVTS